MKNHLIVEENRLIVARKFKIKEAYVLLKT